MILKLYGFGDPFRPDPFRWDAFLSGFAPMPVKEDPARINTHWRFDHPTHPIRFYAPIKGLLTKQISDVHFEAEDVVRLGHDNGWLAHPLWNGLFNALTSWPAMLVAEPIGIGIPAAHAVVVAQPELADRLPGWAQRGDHQIFVAPQRDDFDRLMSEGWDLSFEVQSFSQPREGWADEVEQDEKARQAFVDYITGKRGSVATFSWGGQPITVPGLRPAFLEQYCDWIDWRTFDDEVVKQFDNRLLRPGLDVEWLDGDLQISLGTERKRRLTAQEIEKDQYQTLRALNELLDPDFEIRVVRKEADGDTHGFLFAPNWLWKHLEELDREKLERKIAEIGLRDGFRL
jgi:hypothetical protein